MELIQSNDNPILSKHDLLKAAAQVLHCSSERVDCQLIQGTRGLLQRDDTVYFLLSAYVIVGNIENQNASAYFQVNDNFAVKFRDGNYSNNFFFRSFNWLETFTLYTAYKFTRF
ncbi:MAG: hypothetical protein QM751_06125 [Paludibacteraceae bacterium]